MPTSQHHVPDCPRFARGTATFLCQPATMPNQQRFRAAFEPLSPDLDVPTLIESTPTFEYVPRIHCDSIDEQGLEAFQKLVQGHVVLGGKPLVVGGFNERLDSSVFSEKWLRSECGMKCK